MASLTRQKTNWAIKLTRDYNQVFPTWLCYFLTCLIAWHVESRLSINFAGLEPFNQDWTNKSNLHLYSPLPYHFQMDFKWLAY